MITMYCDNNIINNKQTNRQTQQNKTKQKKKQTNKKRENQTTIKIYDRRGQINIHTKSKTNKQKTTTSIFP